jgi:Zn-finger nucleic acid-binding protein
MTDKFCKLHKTKLIEDSVPILYGTFAPKLKEAQEGREDTYPFANAFVRGPCWESAETHANVQFCPVCREVWLKTSEGVALTNYFAQERPTLEQEIERLRAQQSENVQYARNLRLFRVAFYCILSTVVCALVSYIVTNDFVPGGAIGALIGVVVGLLANRHAAQQCVPADRLRRPLN